MAGFGNVQMVTIANTDMLFLQGNTCQQLPLTLYQSFVLKTKKKEEEEEVEEISLEEQLEEEVSSRHCTHSRKYCGYALTLVLESKNNNLNASHLRIVSEMEGRQA